jgi:hypothetical protein
MKWRISKSFDKLIPGISRSHDRSITFTEICMLRRNSPDLKLLQFGAQNTKVEINWAVVCLVRYRMISVNVKKQKVQQLINQFRRQPGHENRRARVDRARFTKLYLWFDSRITETRAPQFLGGARGNNACEQCKLSQFYGGKFEYRSHATTRNGKNGPTMQVNNCSNQQQKNRSRDRGKKSTIKRNCACAPQEHINSWLCGNICIWCSLLLREDLKTQRCRLIWSTGKSCGNHIVRSNFEIACLMGLDRFLIFISMVLPLPH